MIYSQMAEEEKFHENTPQKTPARKERLSTTTKKRRYLEALRKSLGVMTPAIQAAGIASSKTVYNWRETDPEFAAKEREIAEYAGDFVEGKLYKLINDGDTTATLFYCKTKLKNRGYVERRELTGADGQKLQPDPLTIEIIDSREQVQQAEEVAETEAARPEQ